jgi:hypothetical protein
MADRLRGEMRMHHDRRRHNLRNAPVNGGSGYISFHRDSQLQHLNHFSELS